MGLLERLGLGDDRPREYALVRRSGQPDDPSKIKSYDRPKSPHEVELEEDLPVGNYYLQVIKKNGDFGKQRWSETLFGSDSELEDVKKRAERAEQQAQEAKTEVERSQSQRPSAGFADPNEALRYEIRRGIVQNPSLMQAYGDRIVDWALAGADPDISYSIDNEWQAWLHDVRSNPDRAKAQVELAETLFRRLGRAGVEGVFEGMEGGGDAVDDEAEAVEEDDQVAEEYQPRRSSSEAAIDLDGLAADYRPDAEDRATAQRTEQADAGGAEEPAAVDEGQPPSEAPEDVTPPEVDDELAEPTDDELPSETTAEDIEAAVEALE